MSNISRDLRALARLCPRPVRPEEAAAALAVEVSAIVDEGEALVNDGKLEFRDGGFAPGPQADDSDSSAVRDGQLAASLAGAMAAAGAEGDVIGRLYAAAGRWDQAREPLAASALVPGVDQASAADLAALALQAHERSPGMDRSTEAQLRLLRARHLRATGRSAEAMEELEMAVRWLEGLALVDALRFTTVVADDMQHSQRAETYAALGEREAWKIGVPAEAGSLLSLRGRVLSRIGFPRESDRAIDVGIDLLNAHGNAGQKFTGRVNRAWVQLDRGEARSAEAAFDDLRDEAEALEGPFSKVDKEVYWARAAFATGHPKGALEAVERAEAAAATMGAPVLNFLAAIARAEGALYFERCEEALDASDSVLEFALSDLPAWENRARVLRARALTGLGRLDEATEEANAALAATPEGVDGLRLRKEIEVVRLLALPASATWPQKQVEDLTDELLQARWNLAALELMIERAKRENDPELALQAAGLAIDLGIPTVAIRAAHVAEIWSDPGGQAVGYAAQAVQHQLPDAWAGWLSLPHVEAALAVEVTDDQAATDELTAQWAHVVAESGLAGYEVLSPAQRRAQGLVRRRKATSWARRILTAAAVIIVAGGVSAGMVLAFGPEDTTTDATGATLAETTTTLALEDRELQAASARFIGTTAYRGDAGRTGVFAGVTENIDDPTGYWWKFQTADQIVASPVTFGQWVFVASTDNSIYALETTTGNELWSSLSDDALRATPAADEIRSTGVGGQGGTQSVVVYGDTAGTVYFQNVSANTPFFTVPLDGGIVGAPLILGERAIVVSSQSNSAQIVSFLPIARETEWTYPAEGAEPIGPIRGAPAYYDGVLYVATAGPGEQGSMLLIDIETGELICETLPIGRIDVNPVVVDDVAYVLTAAGQLWTYPAGSCRAGAEGRLTYYSVTGAGTPPAISGNLMIIPIGPRIAAIDVTNLESGYDGEWFFETGSTISSAPVIANGRVYFGDGDGVLNVLDLATGELLWQWDTGSRIVSSPLVMNGIVIVTSTDGAVVAIGDGPTVEPVPEPSDDTDTTTGDTTGETADTTTTTQGDTTTTTSGEPVVTTIIPPTGVGGAQ